MFIIILYIIKFSYFCDLNAGFTYENQDFDLTESQHQALANGFRQGERHIFRMRCRTILLKSGGLSSTCVEEQTEMTAQSMNGWVKRFELEGIKGLYTRPRQGCKPVMDCSDEDAVRKTIESDRQSVHAAKEAWQNASGKKASELTFRRFYPSWRKI